MNPRRNGSIAESKATTKLIESGATVSSPMFEEARYDLIVDIDGKLHRVQCKKAFQRGENNVRVEMRSRNEHGSTTYSSDEVDAFTVYLPEKDEVCWFWFDEANKTQMNIYTNNVDELNAGTRASVRYYEEFLVSNRNI